MGTTDVRGKQLFHDPVTFAGPVYLPTEAVTNANFSSNANHRLEAEKFIHRPDLHYSQAAGTDVVSETKLLRVCRGDGVLTQVAVRPSAVPAGGDKQYTVDVQKAADGTNVWTSLLNAAVVISSADVAHTRQLGSLIADPSVEDGDTIRIVITASGSTGSQGQGLAVTVGLEEQSAS